MAMTNPGLRIRMRNEARRISSQHEKLGEFCREVEVRLEEEGLEEAKAVFRHFEAALDAHMTVEEEIYFPALHGLRPDAWDELVTLVSEHGRLRRMLGYVDRALERLDRERVKHLLGELARQVSAHEAREEELIAHINEGPLLDHGRCAL